MSEKLHREYPNLLFKKHCELNSNIHFLLGECEVYIKAICNTPILPNHYKKLMHVALVKGAQATTAIEGNTLSDNEIEELIQGKQELPPSRDYLGKEVTNVFAALNSLLNEIVKENKCDYIELDLLKRFHHMIGKDLGEHFSAVPGQLRNNDVVVGSYRCPDHRDVPVLLDKFCVWLKEEFGFGKEQQTLSQVIVQAIVAHIYIEWIHPFGDGNGRTGRLIEFYILLRGGSPDIASHLLSNHYNLTRNEYYRQIERSTATRDLTSFIEYALVGFRDGLDNVLKIIQESQYENTWRKFIYDKFDEIKDDSNENVFKRQRTLALELPMTGSFTVSKVPELTIKLAGYYSQNNAKKVSTKTLERDLDRLLELEIIKRNGDMFESNAETIRTMIAKKRSVQLV